MFKSTPVESIVMSKADPPNETNGNGSPLVGSEPVTTPRFTSVWVAIGSGGWFGQGFTQGPQKRLAFLPEQHTDFIFAVVGEELGYFGVTLALTLFLFLFLRIIRVAERANDSFSSLVAFGLLACWFTHVTENVGMTLNLLPITGIPLPFFSYGGSSLVMTLAYAGILLNLSRDVPRENRAYA